MKRSAIGLSLVSVAVTLILNDGVAAADSGGSQPLNINPAKTPVTGVTLSSVPSESLAEQIAIANAYVASVSGDPEIDPMPQVKYGHVVSC
jgi:hypothetical protein